jgi:arabinogalactan endo-1,4-beta-galactosidase
MYKLSKSMIYLKIHFLIIILALANSLDSCSKKNDIPPVIDAGDTIHFTDFAMGVDLSYVNQVEDHGGIYKVTQPEDPYKIFSDKGANAVRIRLWHNPQWVKDVYNSQSTSLYSGFEDVAKSIDRAKKNGMAINLDFHYSDTWADPAHQDVPAAWANITDINVLCDSVYNYTYRVLFTLKARALLPEMIQIGNEINCGMMVTNTLANFPKLSVCDGEWVNQGKVINSAINAVRAIDALSGKSTIIALHVADPKNLDWWFTKITTNAGVHDFNVIGFSYYHIWHTTIAFNDLPAIVTNIKNKFNKDVMVLETAYPFTTTNNDSYNNIYSNQAIIPGYPYTIQGQKDFMVAFTQKMMDAGAKGIMYWEPAWISSNMKDLWGTGSAWENCTFFNYSGNLTEGIDYLNYKYTK